MSQHFISCYSSMVVSTWYIVWSILCVCHGQHHGLCGVMVWVDHEATAKLMRGLYLKLKLHWRHLVLVDMRYWKRSAIVVSTLWYMFELRLGNCDTKGDWIGCFPPGGKSLN